jgi:hypothetical protein
MKWYCKYFLSCETCEISRKTDRFALFNEFCEVEIYWRKRDTVKRTLTLLLVNILLEEVKIAMTVHTKLFCWPAWIAWTGAPFQRGDTKDSLTGSEDQLAQGSICMLGMGFFSRWILIRDFLLYLVLDSVVDPELFVDTFWFGRKSIGYFKLAGFKFLTYFLLLVFTSVCDPCGSGSTTLGLYFQTYFLPGGGGALPLCLGRP